MDEAEDTEEHTSFKRSRTYFDPENTLVYYLGVDYMDGVWRILPLEGGTVVDDCIDVT